MFILLLFLFATSCQAVEFSTRPTNVSIILLHFTHTSTNSSTVLGSFGIWSLMAGLSFGAVGDTTRQIFRGFLLLTNRTKFNEQYKELTNNLFNVKSNGVTVSNNNYVFIDENFIFERDFKQMLIDDYETTFRTLDFKDISGTAAAANRLIETYSSPVKNVLYPEDFKDASLIMSNVMFFKGSWSVPFNASDTKVGLVRSSSGKTGSVPIMSRKMKVPYTHMDNMKASIMELSYGDDGKYCMLIFTPDSNVKISEVYVNFERVTFKDIFAQLQKNIDESGLKEIDVELPKFGKTSKLQMQSPLNDMGIYDAFEPDYARFHRMAREPIYIGTVEHKAVVMVTETGTVAYATTPGLNGNLQMALNEPPVMSPMIFFILEKPTATVLFGGIFS